MYVLDTRAVIYHAVKCLDRMGSVANARQIKYLRVPDEIIDIAKESQQAQQSGFRGGRGQQHGRGDRGRGRGPHRGRGRGRGA